MSCGSSLYAYISCGVAAMYVMSAAGCFTARIVADLNRNDGKWRSKQRFSGVWR